ncbi:MAG: DUF2550 domain-containing protein [Nocardioides sp.]
MPLWELILDAVGVLLFLLLAFGLALILRRRLLTRPGGAFELSYRARSDKDGRGWLLGIGRYDGDRLEWFRVFSLSPRPKVVWQRNMLAYAGRREPAGPERMSLYADHVVVACTYSSEPLELAMTESSLTGFQAWLEAGPPGPVMNL